MTYIEINPTWTAWLADDGRVHFRGDIYQRDAALSEALR